MMFRILLERLYRCTCVLLVGPLDGLSNWDSNRKRARALGEMCAVNGNRLLLTADLRLTLIDFQDSLSSSDPLVEAKSDLPVSKPIPNIFYVYLRLNWANSTETVLYTKEELHLPLLTLANSKWRSESFPFELWSQKESRIELLFDLEQILYKKERTFLRKSNNYLLL